MFLLCLPSLPSSLRCLVIFFFALTLEITEKTSSFVTVTSAPKVDQEIEQGGPPRTKNAPVDMLATSLDPFADRPH